MPNTYTPIIRNPEKRVSTLTHVLRASRGPSGGLASSRIGNPDGHRGKSRECRLVPAAAGLQFFRAPEVVGVGFHRLRLFHQSDRDAQEVGVGHDPA